jgi:hypothetical protein
MDTKPVRSASGSEDLTENPRDSGSMCTKSLTALNRAIRASTSGLAFSSTKRRDKPSDSRIFSAMEAQYTSV